MSDATPTPKPADAPAPEAPAPILGPTPWQRFWRRFSPYGEFPRSSISSLLLHLALVLLLILMSGALKPPEHTPPGIDVVQVGDDSDVAPGTGDGLPAAGQALSDAASSAESPADNAPTDTTPLESVNTKVQPSELAADVQAPSAEQLAAEAAQAASSASRAAQQARRSLEQAKERLNANLDGQGGGNSGGGSGGGGGKGTSGRASRNGRWILRFDHTSYPDLLAQYEALGAELAFPLPNDKYRFFSHLTSQPPRSQTRGLDSESRLYWVEDKRPTVAGIANLLNMTPTSFMLAFLPAELEEKMLKLELSYANLREDQIAKTEFKVVRRGGGYDVIVFSQTPL
ncbi:MAG TPA: hypothetical protein VMV10_00430 [Pirellulales bacterium]|nr:hypothetical protein [Pirellulales bacterium]